MNRKIINETEKEYQHLVELRRLIHQYPEKGYEEFKTSELVISELEKLGCFEIKKSAKTGVVALFRGNKDSENAVKCIGLRADMDALEIEDMKNTNYKSKNKGLCHACGHDAHTTILLGVAHNLKKFQNEISGFVKLFFQPAEETDGGAYPMIQEGNLENPHVDAMLGLHVATSIDVGKIRFCYGTMQASSDEFYVTINGIGAHAAHPNEGVDGILVACRIIDSLHTIVSRYVNPLDSVALSIGKIEGGTAINALAEKVTFAGTLRTLNKKTRDNIFKRIQSIVNNTATAYGATALIDIVPSYPPLINNNDMNNFSINIAKKIFGEENILKDSIPSLGVEDFAYFAEKVPSCFYNIGSGNPKTGIIYPGHNGRFDIDERCIFNGVVMQTALVLEYLKGKENND